MGDAGETNKCRIPKELAVLLEQMFLRFQTMVGEQKVSWKFMPITQIELGSKRCGFFQCRQENLAAHRLTNSWANSLYHVQMWRCWKNIRVTVGSLMRTCLWSLLGENQADLFRKMMSGLLGGLTSTLAVRQGSFGELFGWQIAQIRWHFFSVWVTVCWLAIWLCSNGWAALTSRPFCFEAHIASLGVKWQELYEQRRELANNFKTNKCINFAESYVF